MCHISGCQWSYKYIALIIYIWKWMLQFHTICSIRNSTHPFVWDKWLFMRTSRHHISRYLVDKWNFDHLFQTYMLWTSTNFTLNCQKCFQIKTSLDISHHAWTTKSLNEWLTLRSLFGVFAGVPMKRRFPGVTGLVPYIISSSISFVLFICYKSITHY